MKTQKNKTAIFIILAIILIIGIIKMTNNTQNSEISKNVKVLLKTNMGEIVIELYDGDNKITTLNTDASSIGSGERVELSSKWDVSVPSGIYSAKYTVFYDGQSESFEDSFMVGDRLLMIEGIFVDKFKLGEIAKLDVLVKSYFNQDIDNVFANMVIYDGDEVIADVVSSTETVPAFDEEELFVYWNTHGVEEGVYNGSLKVKYGEKSVSENLVFNVNEDGLDIFLDGRLFGSKFKGGFKISVVFYLVLVFLILYLLWFKFFRKRD